VGRLSGKVALITGIGSGQGRAAALLFTAEGARVIGCDMNKAGAEETVELVTTAGGEIRSFQPVDLSDHEATAAWIEQAAEVWDGFDILYNNASAVVPGALTEISIEDWHYTVRNELDLVFYACRYAWPHLRRRGGGSVINTASIVAVASFAESGPAHHATKGGVLAMTRELAVEGGPDNIRVNAISPGVIDTPIVARLLNDPAFRELVYKRNVLNLMGQPEDIAYCALYLASDESRFVTGANILVDGGITIHNSGAS